MTPEEKEELLTSLVAQALELRDAGTTLDLKALCAGHEDLIRDVAEVLGLAGAVPALQQSTGSSDALAGRVLLGRYRLEERIGVGAMGTVYRARDLSLQRDVAVKLLQQALLGPQGAARFVREGQALASLAHAHIVPVYDRGATEDGIAFLVLQLVDGGSLARWISAQEGGDTARFATVARFGLELAGALAAAHARGICHRDVKPSNVMLDAADTAMLVDFGISARQGDGSLTATGTTLGTPWYMAPEQVRGKVGHEPSVDVYGLCATLWHALALRPPYEGDASSVLARIPSEDPPRLVRVCAGVPKDLAAIVEHGMERDPRQRYAGAAQLEADLRAFVAGLPVAARPVGGFGRLVRALKLRPARYVAAVLLVVAVGVAVIAAPTMVEARATARQLEKRGYELMIPALITIEGEPEARPSADRAERHEVMPIVDKILALDADDVPARLLKAALLFDGDQRAEAAGHIELIAQRRGSAYFAELARRYRAARPGLPGANAVDLAALPAPVDSAERYAEGYQRLRARRGEDLVLAQRVLEPVLEEYAPARDLHLLALLGVAGSKKTRSESLPWFHRAYQEAVKLEQLYGGKTARTRHAIGAALLGMQRYGDAVLPLEESLALRPDRHSVLQNLAIAKRRLGKLDEAEALLRKARELKPSLWNTTYTLAQLLADKRDFEAAISIATQIPEPGEEGQAWKKRLLLGEIERIRGIDAVGAKDPTAAARFGQAALEHYAAAKSNGCDAETADAKAAWARTLVEGDVSAVWRLHAKEMVANPADRILLFSRLLPPEGIPLEHMNDLRLALVQVGLAMNPDSTELTRERLRLTRLVQRPIEPGK